MGDIIKYDLKKEVEQSFLDYSLSVITDRAIPAVEDGLKPVQRRILWTMFENGTYSNKNFIKCASPVGDTMSRYHAHGDASIYGSLVAMSQSWNMRYPLVAFHGNNGSRDGDSPAAYRYTECKLAKISEATMENIKDKVVDFLPNYSETLEEPKYLPGRFPNLLCNGTSGIAVAVACNFAPHNLREVMSATIHRLKNKDCKVADLLNFIQGPDFPTGGQIINKKDLGVIYRTGKGKVVMRGEYKIEKKKFLIFTSMPYKVSKEKLLIDINTLCDESKIEDIVEIRDESNNKEGVRFVIEVGKAASIPAIVNKLYAMTELEKAFNCNQVALVDKVPKLLNLMEIIDLYIEHQLTVLTKKTENELLKFKDKLHIAEGLLIALEDIDKIIQEIKKSENAADAKQNLIRVWKFSDRQAQSILDMKLSKLSHIEKIEVENNIKDYVQNINNLNEILNNSVKKIDTLIALLEDFNKTFGDDRRTTILDAESIDLKKEEVFVEPEQVMIVITENNNLKRIPVASFVAQRRNTKGLKTQATVTKDVIRTNTVDKLIIFTSLGKMYTLIADKIPEGTNASKGVHVSSLVTMEPGEKVVQIVSLYAETDATDVVFVTKSGTIKKSAISEYKDFTKNITAAINLKDGDEVAAITFMKKEDIVLLTSNGMTIRFNIEEVRQTGKNTMGVRGIALNKDDYVVTAKPIKHTVDQIAIFFEDGTGKRVPLSEILSQKRGGKGSKCIDNLKVIDAAIVDEKDEILIVGKDRCLCISAEEIPIKALRGSPVVIIKDDTILSISKI